MSTRKLPMVILFVICLGCGGSGTLTALPPAKDSDLPAEVVRRCEAISGPIILQTVVDDHQHVEYSHAFAMRIDPDAEPDGATHVLIGLARFADAGNNPTSTVPFAVYVLNNEPVRAAVMLPPIPTRPFYAEEH